MNTTIGDFHMSKTTNVAERPIIAKANNRKKTTNLNVRVDEDLKHEAEYIFNELGMNLSTAMNLFLRCAVRYGGIPFDLRLPAKPRSIIDMSDVEFNNKIEKAFGDAEAGKGRPASDFFSELERKYNL